MFFFFFTDSATTAIYTLSLHDALPISAKAAESSTGRLLTAAFHHLGSFGFAAGGCSRCLGVGRSGGDRKSTRLNSSHANISYAVFCLKKKKTNKTEKHKKQKHDSNAYV